MTGKNKNIFNLRKSGLTRNDISDKKIANFKAKIVSQKTLIKHNGIREINITVIGKHANGSTPPEITIPIVEYDKLEWHRRYWGHNYEIYQGKKNDLKESVKYYSKKIKNEFIHEYMGFISLDKEKKKKNYIFLAGNMVIGNQTCDDTIKSQLPTALISYGLSKPPTRGKVIKHSIRKSLDLLSSSPTNTVIGVFLIGMIARSILSIVERPNFSGFIVGSTGALKSSIAGVAQAHFGKDFSTDNLPAHWASTGYANEELLHIAKHVLLVIDDFKYRNSYSSKKLNDEIDHVVRCTANGASRLKQPDIDNKTSKSRPESQPLITGETVPIGVDQSLHYRIIYVDVNPGDLDKEVLNHLYDEAKKGTLTKTTALYIQHILDNKEKIEKRYYQTKLDMHKRLSSETNITHSRVIKNFSSLIASFKEFLHFAADKGAITNQHAKHLFINGTTQLINLADRQMHITSNINFLNALNDALNKCFENNQYHLLDYHTENILTGDINNKSGEIAGWVNTKTNEVYIDRSFDIQVLSEFLPPEYKNIVPTTDKAFWAFMRKNDFLISRDSGRKRNNRRLQINGISKTVYHTKFSVRI